MPCRRSVAAAIWLRYDPSEKVSSTGKTALLLVRHSSCAPVVAAWRHRLASTNSRSASSSVPSPSAPPPSSSAARLVSPLASGPIVASTIAWVPHSATATRRTCGNAVCSPRWVAGRPNAAWLAGVSATSRVVPSTASSRQPRYHAPAVLGAASGWATSANSRRRGSAPNRARALAIAGVEGTCHHCCQRLAQPARQQPGDLLVGLPAEQRHRQHQPDHHPGGQQPLPLLGPARLSHHAIHQLWGERASQYPDRDPIREPLDDRRLDLPGSWHPTPPSNREDAPYQTSKPKLSALRLASQIARA